jgi:NAD(P) transhydrogenase subunit alpha
VVSRAEVFATANVLLQVRAMPPDPALRAGQAVIGFADPLRAPRAIAEAATGVTMLSMELMPRITRAQSMDALSSMATVAGYRAC